VYVRNKIAKTFRLLLITAALSVFGLAQTVTSDSVSTLYRTQSSTGEVVTSTWQGAQIQHATSLTESGAGWTLTGATQADLNGSRKLIFSNNSTQALVVKTYGKGGRLLSSSAMSPLGAGWTPRAMADMNGDGHPDVIATEENSGRVGVFFFGGVQGTNLLKSETIDSLSATGWNVVGAADLNRDGHVDLVLQDASSRQVMIAFLAESNGLTVTATQMLAGSDVRGWSAAGMQDMNGDGQADLILVADATGKSVISFSGGAQGLDYLGSKSLDDSTAAGWKLVVPSTVGQTSSTDTASATQVASSGSVSSTSNTATIETQASTSSTSLTASTDTTATAYSTTSTAPVLIFNGTGTISNAVSAIENVVHAAGLAYKTINSSQLNSTSQATLAKYRLFIVPGGNSITIGKYLTNQAVSNVRNAVAQNGMNYLGMCAGAFFGSYSSYNRALNLTSGKWFKFFADYYKGIHKESVLISFPARSKLDIYWQNGPTVAGWGKVVGKYPNGTAAIAEGYWGKGFVILSGVHPEAPSSWRYGMSFSTPVDVDLSYAQTLVRAAINRTMLPHY
jgi:glutamine amidotransferase-like uncharacterized protein